MFDKLSKDERGVFGYGYAYIVAVVLVLIIFGVLAILISNFASVVMVGMQPIQNMTLNNISQIQDANMSATMTNAVNDNISLQQSNIQMMQLLAGFVGILVLVIVGIVFFLLTQKNVQATQGGLQ
jgi:hypothetical protein